MIEVELQQRFYHYWDNFGLWIHKNFTPATINEATELEFYCVSYRVGGYWGYLNNRGEEVKVIWI